MTKHKIECGDILEHGEWQMNEELKIPALYKISGISTGSLGCQLTLKPVRNWTEYKEAMGYDEIQA